MDDGRKAVLAERFRAVEERIARACGRAGRRREDVTVVAVTKTVPAEVAALACDLGWRDLGENRPQELWRKAVAVPAARWHLIGHLQRNKVARTLETAQMIHAVDSVRLLEAIEFEAGRQEVRPDVLLEVNASREVNKHGFAPEEVPALVGMLGDLRAVRVRGLMTMAAYEDDPERCRTTFAGLRELRDELQARLNDRREAGPTTHALVDLSMGMSNDFEVAVEEGATLVRLGTVLFGGLEGEAG